MHEHVAAVDVRQGAVDGSTAGGATRPPRRVTPGASSRFVAATEWLDDGTPVVSLMGELDLATAPALKRTLADLDHERAPTLVVDLKCCSFIDSSTLGVLMATEKRLSRSGRRLVLLISNPCVLRVFEITRLEDLFAIYPSLELALEAAT